MKKVFLYFPHPLIVAVLAGSMQFLQFQWSPFVAWMGFVSWACYFTFVGEAVLRDVSKVVSCWLCGLIAAVTVIILATRFFGPVLQLEPKWAFPLALGLVALCVIPFERVGRLDWIPLWFLGAACFFALHDGRPNEWATLFMDASIAMRSVLVGQLYGFLTIAARSFYSRQIEEKVAL